MAKVRFIYAEQMFLYYLINFQKLIKESSISPCRAGPLVRVHTENFHLT